MKRLDELLAALFSEPELRIFVHHEYEELRGDLPEKGVSKKALAFEIAELLTRHGFVSEPLFDTLLGRRPNRADDIAAVRGAIASKRRAPAARVPDIPPPAFAPDTVPVARVPDMPPPAVAPDTEPVARVPDTEPVARVPDTPPPALAPDTEPIARFPDIPPPAFAPDTEPVVVGPDRIPAPSPSEPADDPQAGRDTEATESEVLDTVPDPGATDDVVANDTTSEAAQPSDDDPVHDRSPEPRSKPEHGDDGSRAEEQRSAILTETISGSSEVKTRITDVQEVRPKDTDACLVLIYPPGPDMGRRFPLTENDVTIGRASDAGILIDRDSVSRRHARLRLIEDQWFVEDLDSTNGSYVNDTQVDMAPLRDSDFIKIGSAIFKFLAGHGVESAYYEEIYRMAIIDGLTGAYNKRYLVESLERELIRCARHTRPLALILFDIDHFEYINDTYGHLTGDYVLKEMCRRLLGRLRSEELLARYGGEEFACLLPETDYEGAMELGEQARRLVGETPFEFDGETFPVTISVGVAALRGEQIAAFDFIKRADDALYRAKREGRNCVVGDGLARRADSDGAVESTSIHDPWSQTQDHDLALSQRAPTMLGKAPTHRPKLLPDRALRDELKRSAKTLIAMDVLDRRKLTAQEGGAAVFDDLRGAILDALVHVDRSIHAACILGALEADPTLFIGHKTADVAEANALGQRLEATFAQVVRRRSLPNARLVCGDAVVFEQPERAFERAQDNLSDALDRARWKQRLPLPIACAVRDAASATEEIDAARALTGVCDAVARWLAALLVCEAREVFETSPRVAGVAALHDGSASTATWIELLQSLPRGLLARRADLTFPAFVESLVDDGKPASLVQTLDRLCRAQRDLFGKGRVPKPAAAQRFVSKWRQPTLDLPAALSPALDALVPLTVVQIDIDESAGFLYEVRILTGDHAVIPPTRIASALRMQRGHVYAVDASHRVALRMSPLVVYDVNPKTDQGEVLFLDSCADGAASFASLQADVSIASDRLQTPVKGSWFDEILRMA